MTFPKDQSIPIRTRSSAKKSRVPSPGVPRPPRPVQARGSSDRRPTSKSEKVIALLGRPNGASLKELLKTTSWQPHSVRGFLSGVVKKERGLTVQSTKAESGERRYRIIP